jgi:sugar-specific transcriptional regulator TrmB
VGSNRRYRQRTRKKGGAINMIIKQELVKRIKDYFGLNIYETKVWLSLLGKGIASAGEIAEVSGVPRSRTYDVLESLEKMGFAISKIGKPAKYIAVKPGVILEKLKMNTMKEADEKVNTLSKLKGTPEYNELEGIYTTGIKPVKHEDLTGSIKGRSTIYNHVREILENAKKEIVVCTSYRDFSDKIRLFSSLFARLRKNGINIRTALSGNEADIKKLSLKLKEKIKPININTKFFIVDNEQVLFMLSDNQVAEEETAIWLNTPFFTSALVYLFNKIWE